MSRFPLYSTALLGACLALTGRAGAQPPLPASASAPVPAPVQLQAQPFDLTQVKLLDGPFKTAMELDHGYLLSLDPERLLRNFKVEAGLPTDAKPLGGWEAPTCGLRGHFVGHYLSACALMYQSTGDTRLRDRANYVVAELAKCQRPDGYLSAFPSTDFDTLETKYGGVWAPYYTIHKIMAGLFDTYQYLGNTQALGIDEKMAAYFRGRMAKLTPEQIDRVLKTTGRGPQNEFGGMSEVLHHLYAVDHAPAMLAFADTFDRPRLLDPLSQDLDMLAGLHANTHIPQMTGIALHYQLTGDPKYRAAAENFWTMVTEHHSFVTGGNSFSEHFADPDVEETKLSPFTAETCNVYNMLKLTRTIFEWKPDAALADYYERALYNHILGSIQPGTGMTTYFMNLQSGGFKVYGTPEDSFWCCNGTGVENHAKYGDSIYFHNDRTLWVNLFIPSTLNWKQKGLTIRQDTAFPASDTTTLTFQARQATPLAVRIRVPYWATNGVTVRLNGRPLAVTAQPESYLEVSRAWRSGDTLQVTLPMSLRLYHPKDAPGTAAVLYGPLVLAGDLGRDGVPAVQNVVGQGDLGKLQIAPAPALEPVGGDVNAWIKPTGTPLQFTANGSGLAHDITLLPLYEMSRQRYAVYWQLGDGNEQ